MSEKKVKNSGVLYTVKISEKLILFSGYSPLILGVYIIILGSFAISLSQALISYVNFLTWTYIAVLVAYMLQKPLIKFGLLGLLKSSKLEKNIPFSEIVKPLKVVIDLKELRKRWLFHCYCSFGLSLGLVNTVCQLVFNDLTIQYFVSGVVFFLSPILVMLFAPSYYAILDTTSHFNIYIAKSIRGLVIFSNAFTVLFFIRNILTIEYNLVYILSFSSFLLYNVLANFIICISYYTESESSRRSHSYFVNRFLNSLKIKHFLAQSE